MRAVLMNARVLAVACAAAFAFGTCGVAAAQSGVQTPAGEQLQRVHTPQSIDQELARLTTDLQLTPDQQPRVRMLLQEHHDEIQALLDANPAATRLQLAPRIHAISDETHAAVHALLTSRQQQLEAAMVQRERGGTEDRRPSDP
jgi:hypothetical protein